MYRKTFALSIRKGQEAAFRQLLGMVREDAVQLFDSMGFANFSLWQIDEIVFGYYELPDSFEGCETLEEHMNHVQRVMVNELVAQLGGPCSWISEPLRPMRRMYTDIGIVREDKILIRHRVFVTKLKDGAEEEYRLRHQRLEEARGDTPDPGPDSNFTIWYAGGYIFGYDEIDVTMETPPTPEQLADTAVWEMKMLEIMDWRTDDVDAISGEKHGHIIQLASYRGAVPM